ncbi:MAG: hypothetical protein L3J11_02225 [Draconibacterium sp.]|nr:hypothetical protein [Draconibacterium sp.]
MIYEVETEEDYQQAIKRFIAIYGEPKNETEVKEIFLLIFLMSKYEQDNCTIN